MVRGLIPSFAWGYSVEEGHVEPSYPFLHRPLVEFCLALPIRQLLRPGQTRSLLRRALRGLLPDEIAVRKSKRGPDEAILRAVAREWPRLRTLFTDARVYARGYIDRAAFEKTLTEARGGVNPNMQGLLRTIALELWLRSLEEQRLSYRTERYAGGVATLRPASDLPL
jgi:asparagine synthase (glutamine-hydrolysing)